MLTELLAARPDFAPARWVPCPPAADRAAWDALPASDRWIAAGNAAAHSGRHVPPLPLSLWLEFTRTGNRSHFEEAYFTRRRTLCRLVMAECCAWTGAFLPQIADYVWAICEESAWQLPPHNSYIRDTPQLPLPDTRRPVVDLFAAETAALLAMVHYLLGRELEQYAPGIRARIRREVEARALRPWRTKHFWWMGNGDEPMCNWTPWCTQNLLIAAALLGPAARLPAAVRQAAYSLDCFLNGYGEDGCCNEGAQYYSHAGLCLFNALDLLCAVAPGVF
ncbi:MAG: heparinase, partial [Blautia massiliensis (ex Durand et al. 2017)]